MRAGRTWSTYGYTYGDEHRRAEVRFDLAFATGATPGTHQTAVRLVVQGELDALERALPTLFAEVDCLLVGVLRYGATGELVLQVEDVAAFERVALPDGVVAHRSAGWDFFTDRVCPREQDWQRITDRETVEALVAAGADPEAHHLLLHTLVGDGDGLRQAAEDLVAAGFEPPTLDGRRLGVRRRQRLLAEEVSAVTVALGGLCRRRGLVYDGWRLAREAP